ncbi:MAG: TonB-dependent receptor [Bacteroidota bacterium]
MKRCLLFFLTLFLLSDFVMAQTRPLIGKVTTSEDNSTLPGVTILVKGTTNGTVTDIDGVFNIKVESSDTLVFTYVGMQTQVIPVKAQKFINLIMVPSAANLGEMVVVGYSSSSKKLISSSFGIINEAQIQSIPIKTIDNMMQGQSAGIYINQNSGTPGGAMTVRIRGNGSINAGSEPLFIVDGIPINQEKNQQIGFGGQQASALTDLGPNEIESMTILKDASATAIYGARASNGVVLITTKKGSLSASKTSVDFSMNLGWQEMPKERRLKMLNAQQYAEYKGITVSDSINTDWIDEIMRKAPMMNYELSVSGGSDKTKFFLSGAYFKQDGVIMGTSYERLNGRLNLEHKLSKGFTIGANVAVSNSKNKRMEGDDTLNGPLPNAISEPAIFPVYNSNGGYDESGPYANPVAIANNAINNDFTLRTIGNVFLNINIVKGLSFNTKWGFDAYSYREHSYDPVTTRRGARYNGVGLEATTNVSNIVSNNVLSYNTVIKEKHNIDALVGYSFEKYTNSGTYIDANDFPDERLQYIVSAGVIRGATADKFDRGLNSFFGQLKYNFSNKYIITLTGRADGSSKFGVNHKYGYFPAGSVAWRISQEKFFKPVKFINELKLRGSYGLTGNDGIPDFQSLGLYSGRHNYNQQSGIAPLQLPNPDLRWETTRQADIGIDLSVLKDRIGFVFDAYFNKTSDLLVDIPIPLSSGFTSLMSNVGELENRGIELTVNSLNIDKSLKWTTNFNITFNNNKVTQLYRDEPIDISSWGNNRVMVGQPLGVFWGYKSLGVDPSTGDIVFEDMNGDGKISAEDMTVIGNPQPKYSGGLTNVLSYKRFDLNIFLYFVYGNDIYNGERMYIEAMKGPDNQMTTILDRWRQPGDITSIPRATENDPNNNNRNSSRFVEHGSYLRIKNITLTYNFGPKFCEKLHMRFAKVFATISNLYTFTNYSGMDPEVNYAGSSNVRLGTDFFTAPQPRGYNFGLAVGF